MEFCGQGAFLVAPPPGTAPPALRRLAIDYEAATCSHACLALLRSLTHLALTTRRARPLLGPWPAVGGFPFLGGGAHAAAQQEAAARPPAPLPWRGAPRLVAAVRGLAQEGSLEVVEWADAEDSRALFHVGRPAELAALEDRLHPALAGSPFSGRFTLPRR